jgi:hypothetical protein
MDTDLIMLRELGESRAPAEGGPPARVRYRALIGVAAKPERAVPARHRAGLRLAWRLGVAATASAALIAAVLTARTPNLGNAPPAVAEPADAAQVLTLAAEELDSEAVPRPDQYLMTDQVAKAVEHTVHPPGRPMTAVMGQAGHTLSWDSVDGRHDELSRWGPWPPDRPLNEDTRPGCRPGVLETDPERPGVIGQCVPRPRRILDLPADTDAVLAHLYGPGDDGGRYAGWSADDKAFGRATRALQLNPMKPAVLAAMYRAIARIPGVRLIGAATDLIGRRGVAVSRPLPPGQRADLIFDTGTHRYLGSIYRVLDPALYFREVLDETVVGIRPGDPVVLSAVLRMGVVDRLGQLPPR